MGQFPGDVKFCWSLGWPAESVFIDHIEQPAAWQRAKKGFLIDRGGLSLSLFCMQACRYLGYVSCWEHEEWQGECTCCALETGKKKMCPLCFSSTLFAWRILSLSHISSLTFLKSFLGPDQQSVLSPRLCLCSDLCCFVTLSSIATLSLRCHLTEA